MQTDLFKNAPELLTALKARYAEKHRRYHTWSHIEQMLSLYRDVEDVLTFREAVLYAVFYHDAVYAVPATDNEEKSAALFEADAENRIDQEIIATTNRLIIASKEHKVCNDIPAIERSDCCYFLDIDMSILGAQPKEYNDYADNVRKEYLIIPDALYNAGRLQILRGFLSKDCIFLTDYFRDQLESPARNNIADEIGRLS